MNTQYLDEIWVVNGWAGGWMVRQDGGQAQDENFYIGDKKPSWALELGKK